MLGTAQWGGSYGIANVSGEPTDESISQFLTVASAAGVSFLDTAPGYGGAEKKMGMNDLSAFKIITKVPKLASVSSDEDKKKALEFYFHRSLNDLNINAAFGLLFHHAGDLLGDCGGSLLRALNQFKEEGKLSKVGVSIYSGKEIDAILDVFLPDIIQVPLNVLDQRLINSGHLKTLHELGVSVHARSVFLQGLLHLPVEELPTYFDPIKYLLLEFKEQSAQEGLSVNRAALTFVRDQPYVDKVLIGVESNDQLRQAILDFGIDRTFDFQVAGFEDDAFLNPSKWEIRQ